jgi:hypothetical protein
MAWRFSSVLPKMPWRAGSTVNATINVRTGARITKSTAIGLLQRPLDRLPNPSDIHTIDATEANAMRCFEILSCIFAETLRLAAA